MSKKLTIKVGQTTSGNYGLITFPVKAWSIDKKTGEHKPIASNKWYVDKSWIGKTITVEIPEDEIAQPATKPLMAIRTKFAGSDPSNDRLTALEQGLAQTNQAIADLVRAITGK